MKKVVVVILLGVVLGFFGWKYYKQDKGENSGELTFYGNVEKRNVTLAFRFLGEIVKLPKDEGQKVSKGEKVAFLDTSYMQNNLLIAQANLAQSEAVLQKLKAGARKEEIEALKASVQKANAVLHEAKSTYLRQKSLRKKRATSKQSYDDALLVFNSAKADVSLAKANLNLALNGTRKEDILAQEQSVKKLKANVENIKLNIQKAVLISPANGTILERYKEVGSMVSPSEAVLEIAKSDEYWVRAYVDEKNLGRIKTGQKVSIYSDVREKPYGGYISFISSSAEFTPKNIETQTLRTNLVYAFRVIVTNADEMLKQGMPVDLRLR